MTKKRSFVPNSKIKANLRSIHRHDKQRAVALKRAKVDVATYGCETVDCVYMYEGKAEKRHLEMVEKYPDRKVIRGKPEVDHVNPVVDPKVGFVGWDEYINRLYVGADEYKVLCRECHAEKSAKEAAIRKEYGTLKRSK